MKRWLKIALTLVGWAALAAYLIFAARYCERRNADRICTGLNISVTGTDYPGLVTPESIRRILVGERMRLTGARLDSIGLRAVERAIAARPYVRQVRAYPSMDGKLNIEVVPRDPVGRLQTANGYRHYLSADGYAWPMQEGLFIDVPIVSGNPDLPFGTEFAGKVANVPGPEKKSPENEIFFWNLINFVQFLPRHAFWSAQVVQIEATADNEVILVPRIGRGIVRLGAPEEVEEKLDKLFKFYTRGLNHEGWDTYAVIDIRYRGQVICTK